VYKGYKEICPTTDEEYAKLYEQPCVNSYGCLANEYLVVKDRNGNVSDKLKWTGESYSQLVYKQINNSFSGKIKPRNTNQELAFDMLQDQQSKIKVLDGGFGVGKDYLMISHALDLIITKQKYEKIMWVRNNVEVKDSRPLGFLPGGAHEKLLPFAMIIADHVGGINGLELLISQRRIELEHLGMMRGRDIKNTIIMCSESENLTKEHVQLLIGRVGEGSALWMNGDFRQTDGEVFRKNCGLTQAIDRLQGHPLFGYVHLEKVERSEVAAMADLLD
jgi:PhoH-like ATPase